MKKQNIIHVVGLLTLALKCKFYKLYICTKPYILTITYMKIWKEIHQCLSHGIIAGDFG